MLAAQQWTQSKRQRRDSRMVRLEIPLLFHNKQIQANNICTFISESVSPGLRRLSGCVVNLPPNNKVQNFPASEIFTWSIFQTFQAAIHIYQLMMRGKSNSEILILLGRNLPVFRDIFCWAVIFVWYKTCLENFSGCINWYFYLFPHKNYKWFLKALRQPEFFMSYGFT